MRAVLQRVIKAGLTIEGKAESRIGRGLAVLIGIGPSDGREDISYMADKIANIRIFEDEEGKMNLSVMDISGEALLIPNFTLYGDARKGRRPGFSGAAEPKKARDIFEEMAKALSSKGLDVKKGVFGADMKVDILNDGPVTILLDSGRLF